MGLFSASAGLTTTNTLVPTTISGSPTSPGTNFSTPVIVGYVSFRYAPNLVINQGGLNTTNSAAFFTLVGTGTNPTNETCISTNTFNSTASGSISVTPASITVPIYGCVMTVVTNGTQVWQQVITTTP